VADTWDTHQREDVWSDHVVGMVEDWRDMYLGRGGHVCGTLLERELGLHLVPK
jgi:hypothetical protein